MIPQQDLFFQLYQGNDNMNFIGLTSLNDLLKIASEKEEKEEKAVPGGKMKFKFEGSPNDFTKAMDELSDGADEIKDGESK